MDVNNIFSGSSSTYEVLIMPLVFDSSRTFCTSVHLTKAAGTGRETWSCSAMRAAFSSRWCDPAGDPIDRRAVVKNVYDIIAAGEAAGGPTTTTDGHSCLVHSACIEAASCLFISINNGGEYISHNHERRHAPGQAHQRQFRCVQKQTFDKNHIKNNCTI